MAGIPPQNTDVGDRQNDLSASVSPAASSTEVKVISSVLEDDPVDGTNADDLDYELAFRHKSRPSTAHSSIQMQEEDAGDGYDVVDNGSVIMKFSSRPETAVYDGTHMKHLSLHQIARDGSLQALRKAVASLPPDQILGAVNEPEDINEQRTPLHYAARYWHYDVITELINLGADVNIGDYCDYTALHYACRFKRNGDKAAEEQAAMPKPPSSANAKDILESINSPWREQEEEQSTNSTQHTVEQVRKRLIAQRSIHADVKATINLPQELLGKRPLSGKLISLSDDKQAVAMNKSPMANGGADDGEEEALEKPSTSVIELLIDNGADMNAHDSYGVTPLHVCCMRGSLKSAEELLQYEDIEVSAEDKQGLRAIHNACIYGHPELVELLIENGADLRAKDIRRQTPLHRAALAGYPKIVQILLEAAEAKDEANYKDLMLEDLDADNNSPLHLGATKGSPEVCQLLLKHGADPGALKKSSGATALHSAAKAGNAELCKVLLNAGGKIDALNKRQQTPLHLAAYFDKTDCVKLLLKRHANKDARDSSNFTPLLLAASTGSPETIKALLDAGASVDVVDKEERSTFYWAARKGNVKVVELLLERPIAGAGNLIDKGDKEGNTALHAAADRGHLEVVKLLLKHGARIDAKNDDEDTPLINAAFYGHSKVVEVLLQTDPSLVNDIEEHSFTALHLACMQSHHEVVAMLVEAGADVDAKDLDFISVLDYAAIEGNTQSVKTLLKKGAQVNSTDRFGTTPLIRAAFNDQVETMKELLKRGGNVTLIDRNGINALGNAIDKNAKKCAAALLRSKQWEKCLSNWYLDVNNGFRITPLRSLIATMPEVARIAFDKCVKRSTVKDDLGKDKNTITFNYKYLDDVDWARASLEVKNKKLTGAGATTGCCKCCCLTCGLGFFKLGHGRHTCCKGCKKDQATDEEKPKPFLIGNLPEDGRDPLEVIRRQGMEEVFNLEKNHPLGVMVHHGRTELLSHPLTLALINYKWRKFGRIVYYANLAMYCMFLIFLTGYALTGSPPVVTVTNAQSGEFAFQGSCTVTGASRSGGSTTSRKTATAVEVFRDIARPAIFVLAGLNVARELFQLIHRNFLVYISAENGLELACYSTALLFVIDFTDCSQETGIREPWQWQIGAIAVFLAWLNLLLFIRKALVFGIYVVMVMDVFRTFLKFLPVFLFFIIGFALAFHVLLQQQTPFRTSSESLIRTFVMMVGELDFENIFYNAPDRLLFYPGLTHCLFILFLLIVSIILMNLLVGLAVDDIKAVQERATLERLAMQVRMVIEVETMLPNWIRKRFIASSETLPDPHPPSNASSDGNGDEQEDENSDSKSASNIKAAESDQSESSGGGYLDSKNVTKLVEQRLEVLDKQSNEKMALLLEEGKKTQQKTMELESQIKVLITQNAALADSLKKLVSKIKT